MSYKMSYTKLKAIYLAAAQVAPTQAEYQQCMNLVMFYQRKVDAS